MSTFRYNGIELDVLVMAPYEKRAIWNGPDYLYTRHTFRLRACYNPRVTSYVLPASGLTVTGESFPPASVPLASGAQTDRSVRHALMQPRKPLEYVVGGQNVLQVPDQNLQVPIPNTDPIQYFPLGSVQVPDDIGDANQGPIPLYCNVTAATGNKTFLVDYAVQTDVNECSLSTDTIVSPGQPPVLLSNRWSMVETYDRDLYPVRAVQGLAIFRSDRLALLDTQPDNYRSWIIIPLPNDWKRDSLRLSASEDGVSISYSFVDRFLSRTLIQGVTPGVARLEVVESVDAQHIGLEGAIMKALGVANNQLTRLRDRAQEVAYYNPSGALAGRQPPVRPRSLRTAPTRSNVPPSFPAPRPALPPVPMTGGAVASEAGAVSGVGAAAAVAKVPIVPV